jgi:hypothetical protein
LIDEHESQLAAQAKPGQFVFIFQETAVKRAQIDADLVASRSARRPCHHIYDRLPSGNVRMLS